MKKFKNIIFVIIFIFVSFGIVLFNYKMDPYDLERYVEDSKKFNLNQDVPRDLIYIILEKNKKNKYDVVLASGSSGASALPYNFFILNTGKSIAKLAFLGISAKDEYELLERFLELHPETKKAVISLEYRTYLKCYLISSQLEKGKNLSKLGTFIKLYYSFDAIKNSIQKFQKKAKKKEGEPKENYFMLVNHQARCACLEDCLDDNIIYLKKMKKLLDEKQVEAIFFMPPCHSLLLAEYDRYGRLEDVENLKRTYAEITPFYDMFFPNHYTTARWKDNYLYEDVIHVATFHPNFAEVELINIIMHGKNNENVSNYVTKENVEEVIERQRTSLMKYIKENKEEIDEYMNFDYKKEKGQSYLRKILYKDITEEYKQKYYNSQLIKE